MIWIVAGYNVINQIKIGHNIAIFLIDGKASSDKSFYELPGILLSTFFAN